MTFDNLSGIATMGKRAALPTGGESLAHEMTTTEDADWRETTERVGRELLPALERLADALPSVSSVMVSTADGFNLCSIGLDETAVDRVSAMGSALHSVARSAVESLGRARGLADGQPPESLTISHGENITVVLTVPNGVGDHALLWVTGADESLGAILFRAKAAVSDIATCLGQLKD